MSAKPSLPAGPEKKVGLRQGLLAGVITTVVNLAVWAVAKYALAVSFLTPTPPSMELGDFNPVFIVIASLLPALLAVPVYRWLNRLSPNAFLILAIVILIASFAMPFAMLGPADLATKLTLNLMHLVSAVGIIYLVREG